MLLLCFGFVMLLLPFNLVTSLAGGNWANPTIIGLIVGGVAALAVFAVWERFSSVQFFPFRLLQERTVVGALCVYFIIFLSTL